MCIPGLFPTPKVPPAPGPAPAPPQDAALAPISGAARRRNTLDPNAGSLIIQPNLNIP
jgi:hypothetical protein